QKDIVFVKALADDTKVSIPSVKRPWLSEAEGFILLNHDTGRILLTDSQRNTTNPLVAITDSSATDYDSADESSACSTPLPPLKKLDGADMGNKSSSALKVNSAPVGKLESVKIEDDPPLANANPNERHVLAVKRIFRYLKGTINLGLWYPKDSGFDLTAYSDTDHARCHIDRKKYEYVTVSSCCAQVLWMRTQLTDYGFFYDKAPIYCDSKSAIAISCNPVQHTRTKHIDVRSIPLFKEKKVYASVHLSLKKKRSVF
nr:hypothetical protein [Tanacetum cinerariifolium]